MSRVKRALLSVSDKTSLLDLAFGLHRLGVELLSTGGTAQTLIAADVPVKDVSAHTGFPEMMGGRIKTLHPKVHGGILGRRGTDDAVMTEHGIEPIDLVVVNLYPFGAAIARAGCTLEEAIENIDIGGPAMVRAAAKNHASVGVVVDPADYPAILGELSANAGVLSGETCFRLAAKAFQHTAAYDAAIGAYLGRLTPQGLFPEQFTVGFQRAQSLRYGENPHQDAAFYRESFPPSGTVAAARQIQGKEISYNNIADADAALECVKSFAESACVIVKHANPCGVALGATLLEAYDRAYRTDPVSAFGGIIAFNRTLDADTAAEIVRRQFVEVIIAPGVDPAAQPVLAAKGNVRVLDCGAFAVGSGPELDFKRVNGGLLVQERDNKDAHPGDLRVVTRRAPTPAEMQDLWFAWKVARFVKSNAIVYARDLATVGVGAGQMSRVHSARIGLIKAEEAGLAISGSAMASDAFFPFRDGIDSAAAHGVAAVIQPGGSVRDAEVIAAADEHNMAMVFTGFRHFYH